MENNLKLHSMRWKSFFCPWHSVANLQVELPNREQKMTFYAIGKVFVVLGTILPI
jgi:hypothetical protein